MTGKVDGVEKVFEALGHETNFHDGEIVSLFLDREGPTLTCEIWIARYVAARGADGRGYSKTEAAYIVKLGFHEIEELILENFNYQNVVQEFLVDEEAGRLKVRCRSLFGAEYSFSCTKAEVISISETSPRSHWSEVSGR